MCRLVLKDLCRVINDGHWYGQWSKVMMVYKGGFQNS